MPKNKTSDPITDQEMAFARHVLSGTMTDREAAQAAGLNPDTAAYTKAKPCVRAYMLVYRAAMQPPIQQPESDLPRPPGPAVEPAAGLAAEKQGRHEDRREQVLDRLWELAKLGPEKTRNSITGQVKAISIIVAIEGLIPDRRARSAEKKSAPPLPPADIYQSEWLRSRQQKAIDPQPDPAPTPEQEDPRPAAPEPAPVATADVPPPPVMPIGPAYDRSQSVFAHLFHPAETTPSAPQPAFGSAPGTRMPSWMRNIPIARRRR